MEFKALIELVQTITRNKIKHIEVLGNPDQKGSLVESFYDAISKGLVTSDEDAVKYIYGHYDIKDPAYQRLKNRLTRQLINTSIFVDVNQPSFNERTKAYLACYRDFASAFVLILRGSVKGSTYLLEQTLEQAIKFEFIELVTEISRYLRTQTVRGINAQKQHRYYVTLHRQYEEKRRLEMLALDYYEDLIDYYSYRRSPNNEINKLADTYLSELNPLAIKADTARFYFYLLQIEIIKYFAKNDCLAVISLVDKKLPLLKSRKNINRSMLQCTALQKLGCLTQLRIAKGNIGEITFNYCIELVPEGDINWFRTLESYFYYLSYQHNYSEALDIFEKATSHDNFSKVEGSFKDNWLLIGGYLHLLAALKKLDPKQVEAIVGPYRYGKLVNEMQVIDKDREGMNIPLILLPLLMSLANGNNQEYGRSKEALEKYRQRYLDNEINQRSATFVNMLLALEKRSFDPADADKRIQKGLEALAKEQPQVIGQNFAIEIIPYEDLWEMLTTKKQ